MSMKCILKVLAIFLLVSLNLLPLSLAADGNNAMDFENLTLMDGYAPGVGPAVGRIRQISGTVAVVHQDQEYGFNAFVEMDLFKGDIIYTAKDGKVAFKLNDGSFVSLSSNSTLTLTQSVYAPEAKSRSSLMNMVKGKARFVVKKFVDARHQEFKVKTKTAVAGVRGSDFIIMSRETVTEIMALENTALEVFSLAAPEAIPVALHDFERTRVHLGALPEEARRMDAEEVDRLRREFRLEGIPEADLSEAPAHWEAPPVETADVLVPREALIRPGFDDIRLLFDQNLQVADIRRSQSVLMGQHAADNLHLLIFQQKNEDFRKMPLPDFPETP